MRILLVNPQFPITYWGFQYALSYTKKKAALPPLGLLTLAALLPESWELRLVDLNVRKLRNSHIKWADVVFVGGMRIQSESMHEVTARAHALGRRVVAGGAACATAPEEYLDADIVFSGEAEGRIDSLVEALQNRSEESVVLPAAAERPDITTSPVPRYDLLELKKYGSISLQYSRGSPFNCEFCDIIEMFGRRPRVKTEDQILAEMNALYDVGWRGSVFFVDDNFIGNKPAVKKLLPRLAAWQKERGHPYELYTEASVNLAADDKLLAGMVQAGFECVFLGIETPSLEALEGAGKKQNLRFDLSEAIDHITRAGIEVYGGFIVGFDEDDAQAIELQRQFIAGSPIPLAMVGLLNALPGTQLWRRMKREGRLRDGFSGNQFDRPNFDPALDEETLLQCYADLMNSLYSPEEYYKRCEAYIERVPRVPGQRKNTWKWMPALLRICIGVGVLKPWRRHFWRLFFKTYREAPHAFAWAMGHAAMGEHMIRYTREHVEREIEGALVEIRAEKAKQAEAELAARRRESRAA